MAMVIMALRTMHLVNRGAPRGNWRNHSLGMISFQSSYPSWELDAQCKQFLSNIRTFREQMLQGNGAKHAYFSGRYWRDWYYTSRAQHVPGYGRDTATRPLEPAEQQHGDYWAPINTTHNEARDEAYRPHLFDDRSRLHFKASTSAPFFRESILQHHDVNETVHHARSSWWLRTGSHSAEPQTSFPDPPDFNRYHSNHPYDNISNGSVEDNDQFLDWRDSQGLSQTTNLDDLEAGGDVNLHFDDIYSVPPETPTLDLRPPVIH